MFESIDTLSSSFLNVEIDSNGLILKYETNIEELEFNGENLIGKNWFEKFISVSEREKIKKIYDVIFASNIENNFVLSYDVLSFHHKHLYMCFDHLIKGKDEQHSLLLIGHEYYLKMDRVDPYLLCVDMIEKV